MSQITIREVADHAGVAPSTVSRALNAVDGISAETVRTVREAARQLGYEPRRRGRPHRRANQKPTPRRTHRVALLVTGGIQAVYHSPVYMAVQQGVEAALADAGKAMMLRRLPRAAGDRPRDLLAQKADGIILFSQHLDCEVRRELAKWPCVQVMGPIEADEPWDHVSYDNEAAGRLAAVYALERGHRHCAVLADGGREVQSVRGSVFCRAVKAAGGTVVSAWDPRALIQSETVHRLDPGLLGAVLDRLLATRPRPTAIFATGDLRAAAVYPLLWQRGLTPGRDLEVIGCNNEELRLAHLHPRPATIDIHAWEVGRRGVEQLLRRLADPESPRSQIIIEPTLVRGTRIQTEP